VKLLQEAFNRKNFSIEIAALANDTVGTLCTEAYKERNCVIVRKKRNTHTNKQTYTHKHTHIHTHTHRE